MTAARVRKHLPKIKETTLGHMKLTKQGARSTSKGEKLPKEDNARPAPAASGRRHNAITCLIPANTVKKELRESK